MLKQNFQFITISCIEGLIKDANKEKSEKICQKQNFAQVEINNKIYFLN